MTGCRPPRLCSLLSLLVFFSTAAHGETPSSAAREQHFEAKIRPLLVARCGNCHGEQKKQGDLRLDLRESVLGAKPGDGVVVPGKPDDSRLIQVIRYTPGETQMPPTGKIPAAEIELLTAWIRDGAFWPEAAPRPAAATLPKTASENWISRRSRRAIGPSSRFRIRFPPG